MAGCQWDVHVCVLLGLVRDAPCACWGHVGGLYTRHGLLQALHGLLQALQLRIASHTLQCSCCCCLLRHTWLLEYTHCILCHIQLCACTHVVASRVAHGRWWLLQSVLAKAWHAPCLLLKTNPGLKASVSCDGLFSIVRCCRVPHEGSEFITCVCGLPRHWFNRTCECSSQQPLSLQSAPVMELVLQLNSIRHPAP